MGWLPQVQMEDIAIGNKQQKLCSDCQVGFAALAEVLGLNLLDV